MRFAARALRYARSAFRVKGVNIFFFAILCVSEHFESIETHLFFYSKIFCEREARYVCDGKARRSKVTENTSAKHKARGSEATVNASAKHKGAKRPSSIS